MAINISFDWILDKLINEEAAAKAITETQRDITTAANQSQSHALSLKEGLPVNRTNQAATIQSKVQTLLGSRPISVNRTNNVMVQQLVRGQSPYTITTSGSRKFYYVRNTEQWRPIHPKSSIFPNESSSEQVSWYLELMSNGSDVALKLCLARAEELNYYFSNIQVSLSTNDKIILVDRSSKSIFHSKHHNEYNFENFTRKQALKYFQSGESKKPLKISCRISIQVEKCVYNAVPQEIPDFEKLLDDPEFSDLTIITPGKEFKVHKIILTARSEVFSAMMTSEMKEKKEGIINIIDFDDEVIQEFLRYLYCGRIQYLDKLAEELLRAADKYSIDKLRSVCLEEICKKLSVDNALELLTLVDYHKVDHLKAIILNFIVINIKKFDEPQFQLLANSKLSNEILLKVVKLYVM